MVNVEGRETFISKHINDYTIPVYVLFLSNLHVDNQNKAVLFYRLRDRGAPQFNTILSV